jgi:hypothetical protein
MKPVLSVILIVGFISLLFWGIPAFGPAISPWFSTALATMFVALFLVVSHGKAWVALAVVTIFTLIFPLVMLVFIGWGTYPSLSSQLHAIISSLFNHGQFWGAEMLLPLFSGWLVAQIISRLTLTNHSSGTPNGAP